METRALAIAFFYAVGTSVGGITGPLLFGQLIESGDRGSSRYPSSSARSGRPSARAIGGPGEFRKAMRVALAENRIARHARGNVGMPPRASQQ